VILGSSQISFAQDRPKLEEKEIRGSKKVKFTNRSNARSTRATRKENEALGKTLALRMELDPTQTHKYKGVKVTRFPTSKEGRLGADIISLEEDSNFGHIHSIQRMLTSYIQNSFEFIEDDAQTIALYVIYYNAMHRNEKTYFESKYDDPVVGALEVESTGLALTYRQWSGQSQIVLPLAFNQARGKQDIILDELEVEVNKLDNKKIPEKEREKMEEIIDLRKKEDKIITASKDILKEEPKPIPTSKEIVPEVKTETKKEERPIEKKEIPRTEEKKIDLPKKEIVETKVPKEEKREIKEEKVASIPATKEVPVQPTRKEVELEKKVEQLSKENTDLKTKEKDREEKSENVVGDKVLFLKLVKYEDDGHYTNELWVLDASNEQSIYKSPFTNICGKEFHPINEGVVVIGFDGNRPVERIHRLVLLDSEKLSQIKVTKEEIFWRSHVVYRDGKLYAFEKYKNEVYLSRFNGDLTLDARSSSPVNTNSEITFYKDKIFLTGKPSEQEPTVIWVLRRDDLQVQKSIKPVESRKK
jgi:hypothetical protein